MRAGADDAAIARALAGTDRGIKRHEVAIEARGARESQIDLIDVACPDIFLHLSESSAIGLLVQQRLRRFYAGGGGIGQQVRDQRGVDQPMPFEQAEP